MIRTLLFAIVISIFTAVGSHAQDKAKKDDKKPADTRVTKPNPFDKVAGYQVHSLAGFTVIVNEEVLKVSPSEYKKPPLQCIELELKNVLALMNQKCGDALRKVPLWAEWNEGAALSSGRQGQAYAVYYGGNQRQMLGNGMEPLKAKCVTLLLTKVLTKNYQEKDRPETLVMLHELAHAVHDQVLSSDNAEVQAGFQQAMSRKLYDKSLYIATNHHEYFAEATCAFLDRLDYYPKSRDDLKKHDPETYKLMEGVWGKAASTAALKAKSIRPANGDGEYPMDIALASIKWPKLIHGTAHAKDDLKGRVVLVGYVVPDQTAIINRFKGWHDEFGPYGLSVALSNAEYRDDPAEAAAVFRRLNPPFPVHEALFLPFPGGRTRAEKAGHAILFDTTGTILFRGQADDAAIYLKEAIGKRLLGSSGVDEAALPKQLHAAVDALKAGEAFAVVAPKFQQHANAGDGALADASKKLLNVITEPGMKALAEAVALKKKDPLEAFLLAEKVSVQFKGLAVANKAATLAQDLKLDKAVQGEMKARKDLEAVTKLEAALAGQPGSFDPRSPQFRSRNGSALIQLKTACDAMKKNHPNAKATEKAVAIAKEYGLD